MSGADTTTRRAFLSTSLSTTWSLSLTALAGSAWPLSLRAQEVFGRGPAPTLERPRTPTSAPDTDGFIRRWLVLEPIPVDARLNDNAVRAKVDTEYFPDQLTVIPQDGDTVIVEGEPLRWHAVDTNKYNLNLYHFAYALEKPTSNVLFWAVTIVDSPREIHDVRLAIGSNAASVWWFNGEEVIGIYNDRQTVIDDGVSRRITLRSGRNVIRAAVINAGGATDFCARLLDADDAPIRELTVHLD
jgi:hypothetical protein